MRRRIIELLLIALLFAGCQKSSSVEGNWFGSVAEHWESDHDKYIILTLFEGEVLLSKTENVRDETWREGFGTYLIDGNTITFNIKEGVIPKSHNIKRITHAEIVDSEHHDTLLKVYYQYESEDTIEEYWMWFDKTR